MIRITYPIEQSSEQLGLEIVHDDLKGLTTHRYALVCCFVMPSKRNKIYASCMGGPIMQK